jgi:uncharacterized protein (TIGR02996 family)
MPTEDDLLAGIVAHPREEDRWLVLADWLEDQQDPRAELARLRYLLQTEPDHPDFADRQARQSALLDGLAPVVPAFTNSIGMSFALIPPGSFGMGSPPEEKYHESSEIQHRVTLSRLFFLGVGPVTVGAFRTFVARTNYLTDAETNRNGFHLQGTNWTQDVRINWRAPGFAQDDRHPVVAVTWKDAREMVAWLNNVESGSRRIYSLPTEAQWEYACRAGTTTPFFWGEDLGRIATYAWYRGNSGFTTHRIETKKPNAWGLRHMIGNVWEWCADQRSTYPTRPVTDPVGETDDSNYRALRGGGWHVAREHCRSAYRYGRGPSDVFTDFGFRLAVYVE